MTPPRIPYKFFVSALVIFGAVTTCHSAAIYKKNVRNLVVTPSGTASAPNEPNVPSGTIAWGQSEYDFGDLDLRGVSTLSGNIVLTNSGTVPLSVQLQVASESGLFSLVGSCPESLALNQSCASKVLVSPSLSAGQYTGVLTASSSAAASKSVTLKANFFDSYQNSASLNNLNFKSGSITISEVDFGYAQTGTLKEVLIKNTGANSVLFSTSIQSTEFSIDNSSSCSQSNQILSPSSSCSIVLKYNPSGNTQDTATLSLSNASGSKTIFVAGKKAYSALDWDMPEYDFGDVDIRAISYESGFITLTNTGYETVQFSLGATSYDGIFALNTQCPTPSVGLNPGAQCLSTVVLTSPVATALGAHTGDLVFNSSTVATKKVALKANYYDSYQSANSLSGIVFSTNDVAATTFDFGTNIGVISKVITVKNTAQYPVLFNSATNSGAFSILNTSTCAVSRQVLASGQSCGLTIQYTPSTSSDTQNVTISNLSGNKSFGVSGAIAYADSTTNWVSPTAFLKGSSIPVVLSGTGYSVVSKVQYKLAGGSWTDASITSKSNTGIGFTINASIAGTYSLRLINPDNSVNGTISTNIVASDTLSITNVSPAKVYLSNVTAPYSFAITGTGFNSGDTISLDSAGANLKSGTDVLGSTTSRSVQFSSLPSINSGLLNLKVNSIYASQSASQTVTIVGVATVSGITPATTTATSSLSVTISGSNLAGLVPQYKLGSGSWTAPTIVSQSSTQLVLTINANTVGIYSFRLLNDDNTTVNYTPSQSITVTANSGEAVFTTPGTFSWTAPAGVTSVSVVAVGGGGAGGSSYAYASGGGGALAYVNNIPVTPGEGLVVVVGAGTVYDSSTMGVIKWGGDSGVMRGGTWLVQAGGGSAAWGIVSSSYNYGIGGSVKVGTGGKGGNGGRTGFSRASGGGGAGGYSGAGGNGGWRDPNSGVYTSATAGSGGGGAGGQYTTSTAANRTGGGGGGTGLYGQGANGAVSASEGGGGGGGSTASLTGLAGSDGLSGTTPKGDGGFPGGGGGASITATPGDGAHGAVRIIWGTGRSFPSNAS